MSGDSIFIIAGEASGDLHGAGLVRELRRLEPDLDIWGVGGARMAEAGVKILVPSSDLAVVGILEVFSHIKPILSAYFQVRRWLRSRTPGLLILIDFPEFNLLVARVAKGLGIPVFYYISPQIWAWRQGRVKKIRRLVDKMAVILPFEEAFYRKHGVEVEYVGHPLLDTLETGLEKQSFLKGLGIEQGQRVVSLLPGSREGEIRRHLPLMLNAAGEISRRVGGVSFLLPVPARLDNKISGFIDQQIKGLDQRVILLEGQTRQALECSDLAVCASGTVTLEAAITTTPMIVTYRLSWPTYVIGRMLIKVPWVSLVNLIAQREVVPELLQDAATARNISDKAVELLTNESLRNEMRQELRSVVKRLGSGGASTRAARAAMSLLARSSRSPGR